jgi:drug/metabolite transporter (DMT)-like permease
MLFWTGVITTAFTIWMETLALKTLSAAETTLIFSTEPLFGAAFASVVAHECLGPEAFVGAACIIGGCLVSGIDLSKQLNGLSALKLGKEAVSK